MAVDLETVSALIKFLGFFFDRKAINMARARACIDACERYILVDEKSVPYADINDERQVKLKVHFKKRFVAYNN